MFHLLKSIFSWIISFFSENGPREFAEQSTHKNKTICTKWNFWKHQSESSYHIKGFRKYQFKCHKWDFCHKKSEIESNFLTTLTDEPKFESMGQHHIK